MFPIVLGGAKFLIWQANVSHRGVVQALLTGDVASISVWGETHYVMSCVCEHRPEVSSQHASVSRSRAQGFHTRPVNVDTPMGVVCTNYFVSLPA